MTAAAESGPRRAAARAWCRADLGGGTLDIWPLGLLHRGARTVNVALAVEARVELAARPAGYRVVQRGAEVAAATLDELAKSPEGVLAAQALAALELPPVDVAIACDSPRGAGLGGSSALMIALLAAGERFSGGELSEPAALAGVARDLEARMMGLPTGRQDHYPALLGGALEIRFEPGGDRVRRLDADLEGLGRSMVVAYSGRSHFSAATNWQIIRRRLEAEPETVECLDGVAAAAAEMPRALEEGALERLGGLMEREWSFRRRLAPGISTPELEALLDAARRAGGWGGKALGAGGGGSIAVLAPPERRPAVVAAVEALGARVLEAPPAAGPVESSASGSVGGPRI